MALQIHDHDRMRYKMFVKWRNIDETVSIHATMLESVTKEIDFLPPVARVPSRMPTAKKLPFYGFIRSIFMFHCPCIM